MLRYNKIIATKLTWIVLNKTKIATDDSNSFYSYTKFLLSRFHNSISEIKVKPIDVY